MTDCRHLKHDFWL